MAGNKSKPAVPTPESVKQQLDTNKELDTCSSWQGIKHFAARDFACKCNGYCDHVAAISPETVAKLAKIRDLIGKPLTIISGTRCEKYNRMVGGTLGSAHIPRNGVSRAVDIRCPDSEFRFAFLTAALSIFNRIGIGKDFIHVDDDPDQTANVVWQY